MFAKLGLAVATKTLITVGITAVAVGVPTGLVAWKLTKNKYVKATEETESETTTAKKKTKEKEAA